MSSHKLFKYPLRTYFSAHKISLVAALFVTIFEFNICWVSVDGYWAEDEDWREHCCLHCFSLVHFSLYLVKGLKKLPLFVTFFICLFPRACSANAHLPDLDNERFLLYTIQRYFVLSFLTFLLKLFFFQPTILKYPWCSNRYFVSNTKKERIIINNCNKI